MVMKLCRWMVLGTLFAACLPVGAALKKQAVESRNPVQPIAHFQDFTAQPEGWTHSSPRPEIAPRFSVDRGAGRQGGGALRIDGGKGGSAFGAWRRNIEGISGGKTYRFRAWYRTRGVSHVGRSVSARLEWLNEKGEQVRPPDYVGDAGSDGDWARVEHVAEAPEGAKRVVVQLALGWAPGGSVWWDDIRLEEETSPPQRVIRAATIFHRPRGTKSAAESVEQFCRIIEAGAAQKPDILCLPEGITVIGNGKSYAEVSEPIPGPTTQRLGVLARKLRSYIVAGIYERVGEIVYNTAVLIDREGKVAGTYRKTHLPREEVEAGITPGDSYPVFKTDFGTVGLMICWDLQFPEPARALALKGAEVILLPIWGGSEVLAQARAIENHLFMITSSYDMKTFVVDPAGRVLAEATAEKPMALAELHLDRKIVQPWLGDMKVRTWKERRPDLRLP